MSGFDRKLSLLVVSLPLVVAFVVVSTSVHSAFTTDGNPSEATAFFSFGLLFVATSLSMLAFSLWSLHRGVQRLATVMRERRIIRTGRTAPEAGQLSESNAEALGALTDAGTPEALGVAHEGSKGTPSVNPAAPVLVPAHNLYLRRVFAGLVALYVLAAGCCLAVPLLDEPSRHIFYRLSSLLGPPVLLSDGRETAWPSLLFGTVWVFVPAYLSTRAKDAVSGALWLAYALIAWAFFGSIPVIMAA